MKSAIQSDGRSRTIIVGSLRDTRLKNGCDLFDLILRPFMRIFSGEGPLQVLPAQVLQAVLQGEGRGRLAGARSRLPHALRGGGGVRHAAHARRHRARGRPRPALQRRQRALPM
eukprot:4264553-Pyramimonas_sp.AAC.1